MSYRELRNFAEIMRNLGYPMVISMDSFSNPNFVLVADMLYWLIQRYDPMIDLDDSISTETERIQFLKAAAQKMFFAARIKLNLKRLYAADRHAVRELLKIAHLLNRAMQLAEEDPKERTETAVPTSGKFMDNVRAIRSLATELTEMGSELYDSLNQELELRKTRTVALEQPAHDANDLKRILEEKIADTQEIIANVREQTENLQADEENMMVKTKRRAAELERTKKNLERLQTFKPSFMEEYEKREEELQYYYSEYVSRWRNLEYLEHVMDAYRREEEREIEEKNKQLENMRKKLKDEELMILRGEKLMDSGLDDDLDAEYLSKREADIRSQQRSAQRLNRPRAASGRRTNPYASGSGMRQRQHVEGEDDEYEQLFGGYEDDDDDEDEDDYDDVGSSEEDYEDDDDDTSDMEVYGSEEEDDDDDDEDGYF